MSPRNGNRDPRWGVVTSGALRWTPEVLDTGDPIPHDQDTVSAGVQPTGAGPTRQVTTPHQSRTTAATLEPMRQGTKMNKFRLAGWLAVGGLLGAALLAPSAAFATDLKDAQQGTSWNDQGFQGSARECEKFDLGAGDVVWHFVLTSPEADSGHLTATFQNAGDVTVANADSPAAVLHFYVWTGHDTLLDAETTDVDGNNLVLSHICSGAEEESESVPVESVPVESDPVVTPCAECAPATQTVPDGSVEAETGTPDEDVTPPSTDTLTPTNTTASNDGWQLVLIALAALIASALVLTPASRKIRR